jgi:hypothetical protein
MCKKGRRRGRGRREEKRLRKGGKKVGEGEI